LWIGEAPGETGRFIAPAVGEGGVFAGVGSRLYAFNANGCGAATCAPVWHGDTTCADFTQAASVANGVVYAVCGTEMLYAFDAATGEILWNRTTTGAPYHMRSPPAIVDGWLFYSPTFSFRLDALSISPIFTDGFESGDTSAWSATVP
jgi:outer membrane protein assembly factor BamB